MAANDTNNDRAGLAAEYVLGTLDTAERREAEALIATDIAFRQEVLFWEDKLTNLLAVVPAVEPPADTFDKIMSKVGSQAPFADGSGIAQATNDNVVQLNRRMRFWRRTSIAASFVALSLMAILVGREVERPVPQDVQFVAVLETGDNQPAFVASIDTSKKLVHVVRLSEDPGADRSYELWAIKPGSKNPESLGVVDNSRDIGTNILGTLDPGILQNTTFAVSLEKKGGSPTGKPTDVKFVGKLVPLRDLQKKK